MDRSEIHEGARAIVRGLDVEERGADVTWSNPATGTSCTLDTSGLYEVRRKAPGGAVVPVILGHMPPSEAQSFVSSPRSRQARLSAANVIAIVDAMPFRDSGA